MDLILSTRNRSKVEQIKEIFNGVNVNVISLGETEIVGEAVEDGLTLEENASKKAHFVMSKTGGWSMADDTGLFIDALDGKPGIYAARWAGEGLTTEQRMNFVIEQMKDIPVGKRTATFTTVAVLVSPEGKEHSFSGSVRGSLLPAPRVSCQPDMPYSALFVPEGQEKAWSEMSVEEENAISHRGIAFRQVRDFMAKIVQ